MAEVRFQNVSKRFGGVVAVDQVTFTVQDREFMTLVGPSGCGKSTTLNLLAGLEEASEGEIAIGGTVVNDVPPGDRNVAMVFQSYALYPHMNVFENMAFGLRIRKTPGDEINRRVREAARTLSIEELLERKPAQLSGGQRQRVALGRAIVRSPSVFLLDEPLSNLDAILRVQMRAELRLLFDRLGSTVVYVTHDQAEAMTLSDRLIVFYNGTIQQLGTPLEIYNRPTNAFVARFIGSPPMNLIPCDLARNGASLGLHAPGFEIPLAGDSFQTDLPQRILAGMRPEDITLGAEGLPACAKLVEQLGSESIIYAELGGKMVSVKVEKGYRVTTGENVRLRIDPGHLHLFDAGTEKRVN